jgi:putative membrane protein insertion efficiency factor
MTITIAARVGIVLIQAYQISLGAWFGGSCRFQPSCSHYAIDALRAHGLMRGSWLALRRISRCHPFTPPGMDIDPVPPPAGR